MKHLEEIKLGIRILMLDDVIAGSQWLKITHNVSLDLSKNIFQCDFQILCRIDYMR